MSNGCHWSQDKISTRAQRLPQKGIQLFSDLISPWLQTKQQHTTCGTLHYLLVKDASQKLISKGHLISSHLTQPGFLLFMYTNRIYLHLLRGPGPPSALMTPRRRGNTSAPRRSRVGSRLRTWARHCRRHCSPAPRPPPLPLSLVRQANMA